MQASIKDEFLSLMKSNCGYVAKFADYTKDIQLCTRRLLYQFNNCNPDDEEKSRQVLKQLFQNENLNIVLVPPFHCDYGFNIHFKGFALINSNCSILDTSPVYIGENTLIAPGVCIACAGHAIHHEERTVYNTSKSIHIGKNVWIGANSTILAGVHIGNNSIIGAGSVVNKDIPENVIAVGNPCKVLRKITDEDKLNIDVEMMRI